MRTKLNARGKYFVSVIIFTLFLFLLLSLVALIEWGIWNARAVDTRGNYSRTVGEVVCEVMR